MLKPMKRLLLMPITILLLAGCSSLPLPGGNAPNPGGSASGEGTIAVDGPFTKQGENTYYGGDTINLTLQNVQATNVVWSISQGEITANNLTATIPYSTTNRQALRGDQKITITARWKDDSGTQRTAQTSLYLDDAPPTLTTTANGTQGLYACIAPDEVDTPTPTPVTCNFKAAPGAPANVRLVNPQENFNHNTSINFSYQDVGVGMKPITTTIMRDGLTSYKTTSSDLIQKFDTSILLEGSRYSLQVDEISDLLGNRAVTNGQSLIDFKVDVSAPVITANPALGVLYKASEGDDPSNTRSENTVVIQASDPALDDFSSGSGIKSFTVSPAYGQLSGDTLTLNYTILRSQGLDVGSTFTLNVTATDLVGHKTTRQYTFTISQ